MGGGTGGYVGVCLVANPNLDYPPNILQLMWDIEQLQAQLESEVPEDMPIPAEGSLRVQQMRFQLDRELARLVNNII